MYWVYVGGFIMKKNVYLGLDSTGEYCCILESHLSFNVIKNNIQDLEETDFNHSATNWSGKDDLDRTIKLRKITLTGRKVLLPHEMVFIGSDYDMGHEYGWKFTVSQIAETTDKMEYTV